MEDADRYVAVDLALKPYQTPEAIWQMLGGVHAAMEASGADIDYGIDQNSNSSVRSALYTVGIGDDRIEGVWSADVIQGGSGDDRIDGGGPQLNWRPPRHAFGREIYCAWG